jgi:hypothetical protein
MYRKIRKLSSPGKKRRLSRQDAHIYDTPQGSFDKGANMDPALAVIYSVIISILTPKKIKKNRQKSKKSHPRAVSPADGTVTGSFLINTRIVLAMRFPQPFLMRKWL